MPTVRVRKYGTWKISSPAVPGTTVPPWIVPPLAPMTPPVWTVSVPDTVAVAFAPNRSVLIVRDPMVSVSDVRLTLDAVPAVKSLTV